MQKKFLLTTFLILSLFSIIFPSQKENTKIFDYCFSLEKILFRNSIQKRRNKSEQFTSISKDISKFGISKTKGALISKLIDQYKTSKNYQMLSLVPNNVYCYGGYWVENINPGTFESLFISKSKKTINEFKGLKDEVDGMLNNINSEYKTIRKEFNSFF